MVLVFIVFMWVVNYEDSKWHTQAILSTIFYDAHLGTIGLNFHNKTMFFFIVIGYKYISAKLSTKLIFLKPQQYAWVIGEIT